MKTTGQSRINQHRPPIDPEAPSVVSDTLRSRQQLGASDALVSRNGLVRLVLTPDGNLEILRSGKTTPLWSSNTAGKPVTQVVMRADGSLACVDGSDRPYWSTPTSGNPGSRVTLQNDGNLVVYSASSTVLWSSNSASGVSQQTHVQVVLDRLTCAKTTELGHDEIYYLFAGTDGSGKDVSHRGPDAKQSADADDQTAWDMNDSGSAMSRNLQATIGNESVLPGQDATFTISFHESDGQDWGSTVKAAAAVASKVGSGIPIVSIAADVLSWLGSEIPTNKDDDLGAFVIRIGNDAGKIVVRDLKPGEYTTVVHPLDTATGAFTLRFRHDDGDYTASFRVHGI